jgi:hypothetical protein
MRTRQSEHSQYTHSPTDGPDLPHHQNFLQWFFTLPPAPGFGPGGYNLFTIPPLRGVVYTSSSGRATGVFSMVARWYDELV